MCLTLTLTAMACLAQNHLTVVSPMKPHGIPVKNGTAALAGQTNPVDNGIEYHGGPVLNDPHGTNVYFIWYGNWTGDSAKQILPDFVQHLGGSPYFNINTTYYDFDQEGEKEPVLNKVNFWGSVDDNYTFGTSLTDNDVATVITNHIGVDLPLDTNGMYFVLTSGDVSEQEDPTVGGAACAFHGPITLQRPERTNPHQPGPSTPTRVGHQNFL